MTTLASTAHLPVGERIKRIVLPAVPFVLLLAVWGSAKFVFDIPRGILPDVISVFRVPFTLTDQYLAHTIASVQRLLLGFAVAAVSGLLVGLGAGLSRRFAEFIGPLSTFMNAISGIAWIPLAIAWFGIGTPMVVFIIWNSAFFLVLGNTILGVRLVPRVLEQGLFTLGASRFDVIRHVIFPGAMPHIVAGLRSGLGFGWRAVIAAELVGATVGLGQWIFIAQEFRRTDIIIAGAFTIGAIGLLTDRGILAPLERRTVERWGMAGRAT
ncbi:MAG: ABC transporter permease [Chloroflexia bacterium]|nr:ABC transporter permease [Chloroflexia bacterium]